VRQVIWLTTCMKRVLRILFAIGGSLFLLALGIFSLSAGYPSAYLKINSKMSRAEVGQILSNENFIKDPDWGIQERWHRKQFIGIWYVSCVLVKDKPDSVYACYQIQNKTIRARGRNLE